MALTRRSSATERPVNVKRFRPASACDPLFTPMFIAVFCDETFKSVKKMGPFRRPGNKDVAAIRIITLPAQIAESTQLVQGANNDRLWNVEFVRNTPYSMRAGQELNNYHQDHLAIC